jgi:hypothetical protein
MQTAFCDAVRIELLINEIRNYTVMIERLEALDFKVQLYDYSKEFKRQWYTLGQNFNDRATLRGILHSSNGNAYPMRLYRRSNGILIDFNGVTQYKKERLELSECSQFMRVDMILIMQSFKHKIKALDLCVDVVCQ